MPGTRRLEGVLHELEKSGVSAVETVFRVDQLATRPAKRAIRRRVSEDFQRLVGEAVHIKEISEQARLKLMGEVEVNETYIGGEDKNRHRHKRKGPRGTNDKIPVIGAIARKGNVVCRVIEHATAYTLDSFVRETVSERVDWLLRTLIRAIVGFGRTFRMRP